MFLKVLALAAALASALLLVACGGDDGAATPTADTTGSADVSSTTDGPQADGAAPLDTAGPADTGPVTPQDVPPPTSTCGEILGCVLASEGCLVKPDCVPGCSSKGSDKAKADFAAVVQCSVQLCGEATTTQAKQDCLLAGCATQIDTCAELDESGLGCSALAACLQQCDTGKCAAGCLGKASKKGLGDLAAMGGCYAKGCAKAGDAKAIAGCMLTTCKAQVAACAPLKDLDCGGLEACAAECPKPADAKSDMCGLICMSVALPEAVSEANGLGACTAKECGVAVSKASCVSDKCGKEQDACFGTDGTSNCMEIHACVKADCQGLGGDEACVQTCFKKGKADAKAAFADYNGCMSNCLERRPECTFPYDQACLNLCNGLDCTKQNQDCFQPK